MKRALSEYPSLTARQRMQVLEIELLTEQRVHAGDIHGALHTLSATPATDTQGYVLLLDDIPRGFFVLRRKSLLPRWASGSTATLHALMIDRRYQGRGLGKHCMQMLPGLVRDSWPEVERLMLAVERTNSSAHALYQALGWRDSGDCGRPGDERRMELTLA